MSENSIDRRSFLKASSSAAVAVGTFAAATSTKKVRAADSNGLIRIGFIGPGGRGFGAHVKSLATLKNEGAPIELAAVAEVYSVQRDKVADYIEKENGKRPTTYVDYREMLEKEDLDAVCVGDQLSW